MRQKKKPGVMVYFTVRKSLDHLSREQCGDLFLALLAYADPEDGTEPTFADDTLTAVWPFVRDAIDRDGERYDSVSVKRHFAAYCAVCARNGETHLEMDDWLALGGPT